MRSAQPPGSETRAAPCTQFVRISMKWSKRFQLISVRQVDWPSKKKALPRKLMTLKTCPSSTLPANLPATMPRLPEPQLSTSFWMAFLPAMLSKEPPNSASRTVSAAPLPASATRGLPARVYSTAATVFVQFVMQNVGLTWSAPSVVLLSWSATCATVNPRAASES